MVTTAYLSSTVRDLQECRAAAASALRRLGVEVAELDLFAATQEPAVSSALARVVGSDIYIGIFAWQYGHVPDGYGKSITELEYQTAVEHEKPCLIFLLSEDAPWPHRLMDFGPESERIRALRAKLVQRHLCAFFTAPEDLAVRVTTAVANLLSDVQQPGQGRGVFSAQALSRYFERFRQRYGRLTLGGLTPVRQEETPPAPLTDLFVEPTLRETLPPDWAAAPAGDSSAAQREWNRTRPRRRLSDVIADPGLRRLVLLGDPGSGKSAAVRYLVLVAADGNALLADHVPLMVQLREYSAARYAEARHGFLEYVDRLAQTDGLGLPKDLLSEYLRTDGRALVIFDGLDEVLDRIQRSRIADEIVAFAAAFPRAHVIVTSRIVGYSPEAFADAGFRHFMIQDLDDTQIDQFLARWVRSSTPATGRDVGHAHERLSQMVHDSPSVRALARNPLLLTILAIMGRYGSLPHERLPLFDYAASVLLEHWDVNRHLRELDGVPFFVAADDKKLLLGLLAFRMMSGAAGAGNTIDEPQLLDTFATVFTQRYGMGASEARTSAAAMLRQFEERAFVLARTGPHSYGFLHRAFYEYFCANWLIDRFQEQELSREELREIAVSHRNEPDWQQTLELVSEALGERVIVYELGEVFKASGVPRLTFVEPADFSRFLMVLRQPGRGIVIEGPSGIGKTTFIRQAEARELERGVKIDIRSARRQADLPVIRRLPEGHEGIVAVDDFHRLDPGLRDALSDYLKLLADEESENRLIIIGIPGVGKSLVELSFDLATRIDVFRLTRASTRSVEEMIEKGEQSLNVTFANREGLVREANGSLLTAQMLCWHVAQQSGVERTEARLRVLDTGTDEALRLVESDLARKYDDVVKQFSQLDGTHERVCIELLNLLSRTEDGILSLDAVKQEHQDLAKAIDRHLLKAFPAGFGAEHSNLEHHLYLDPVTRQLVAEDPQFLFYLRRQSAERLVSAAGKRTTARRSDIFISYSHKDRYWLNKLKAHLEALAMRGKVTYWVDTDIRPAGVWRDEIEVALDRAAAGVLMVTPAFLQSPFIREVELRRLLERASVDGCQIWPLIVKHSVYTGIEELARLQSFNAPSTPLNAMRAPKQDEVLSRLALALAKQFPRDT
jgi:hypothetical protein